MANQSIQTLHAEATADDAILAAWERRKAAYLAFDVVHGATRSDGGVSGPAEAALWREIGEAQTEIASSTATTLAGVEAQLWTALHLVADAMLRDTEDAVLARDIGWLEAQEEELEPDAQIILAALRSLRAIEV